MWKPWSSRKVKPEVAPENHVSLSNVNISNVGKGQYDAVKSLGDAACQLSIALQEIAKMSQQPLTGIVINPPRDDRYDD
jgi:hypothetical protein